MEAAQMKTMVIDALLPALNDILVIGVVCLAILVVAIIRRR